MRIRSFRLRIALLSVLVSGATLVAFGVLTLAAVQRLALQRMDSSIREFAHKHLMGPVGPRHWEGLDEALSFFLGSDEEDTFILLVTDQKGHVLHASANWPQELPMSDFARDASWGKYANSTSPQETQDTTPGASRDKTPLRGGASRRNSAEVPPPDRSEGPSFPLKIPEFTTGEAGGVRWRIGMMGNPETTIVLGLNTRRLSEETAQVRHAFLVVLPIALIFVATGASWLSQSALNPTKAVTETIKRVKAKGLDQRIAVQEEDRAFSELIAVFNDMMDWLEKSFHQAIRFSADASHELKTPLTVLQTQLEEAVQEAEPGSDEQRRYVALGKELQRLKSITQKLLLLSRIDAGELKLVLRPLNMSELLEGVVEDTETLARQLEVTAEIGPDLWVLADADLLKQVVQNLSANAMKFNHRGGFVRFQLCADDQRVLLITQNSGPGIPPDDRKKLFTRFYRADKARNRHIGGAGLGLSLAREIARAHHGDLTLVDSPDAKTTTFMLTLPRGKSI